MDEHADGRPTEDREPAPAAGTAWWSPRAIGLHVTLVVVVPLFAGLFWWQVQRVRQGNTLSWAYVFEWPFFAGYAVYLWWRLVHEQPEPAREVVPVVPVEDVEDVDAERQDEREDEELAAYNRYLAQLDASGRPKRW
ncbi:MAG: hypothetical protein ACRDZR_03050 [Acidimicrobiales bacterium]